LIKIEVYTKPNKV